MGAVTERLRRVGAHPRIEPATALALRGRQVRETGRFVLRELCRRRGERAYRLRESGMEVRVRHRSGDVVTLGEIFHRPDYEPPSPGWIVRPDRILDLGANVGMFGLWAHARWPRARITAYEADPANAAVHARVIQRNGLDDRWRLVRAAAGASDGKARFASGAVALSHVVEEGGDLEVDLRDVLPEIAETDLLKMDIEGGEWAILGDQRFAARPPRAVVLEYHPRMCPGNDPHTTVLELLASAGMQTAVVWSRSDGHGLIWARR